VATLRDRDEEGSGALRLRLRGLRDDSPSIAKAEKLLHKAIASVKRTGGGRKSAGKAARGANATRGPALQRVAVRFSYSKSSSRGLWKAHGSYIERESAQQHPEHEIRDVSPAESQGRALGFGSTGDDVRISETLDKWQEAGDEHLFRVIVSPEFGVEIDLKRLTKEFMGQFQSDLGPTGTPRQIEWVAVAHFNTDNPHVHVAIRGVDAEGHTLRIPRAYIQEGARVRAQQAATRQIGYRTEQDKIVSLERQVNQTRFTDIDRGLIRESGAAGQVSVAPRDREDKVLRNAKLARLSQLEKMGLTTRVDTYQWQLSPALERSLRAMQIASDLLKTKALHRARISDPALPLVADRLRDVGNHIAGRLVGTGWDDNTNRPYLLIEGVDGKVHYVDQTLKMQDMRGSGELVAGDYVSLDVESVKGRAVVRVQNYGREISGAQVDDELLRAGMVRQTKTTHTVAGKFSEAAKGRLERLRRAGAVEVADNGRVLLRNGVSMDRLHFEDAGLATENHTDGPIAGRIEAKGRETIAVNDGSGIAKVMTAAQLKEAGFELRFAREGAFLFVSERWNGRIQAEQVNQAKLEQLVTGVRLNKLDGLHGILKAGHPLREAVERRAAQWVVRGIDPDDEDFRVKANTWSRSMDVQQRISEKGVDGALSDLSRQLGKPVMDLGLAAGARVTGRVVMVHTDAAVGARTIVIDNNRQLYKLSAGLEAQVKEGQRVQARAEQVVRANKNRRVLAWRFADLERQQLQGKNRGRAF